LVVSGRPQATIADKVGAAKRFAPIEKSRRVRATLPRGERIAVQLRLQFREHRMSSPSDTKTLRFADAAKLIAADENDVGWLSYALLFWIWPQIRSTAAMSGRFGPNFGMFESLARMRHGRADVVRTLKTTLPTATAKVVELLRNPVYRHYIFDPAFDPKFGLLDDAGLLHALNIVSMRARKASQSPELVTATGKAKPGRNKVLTPGQPDEKVACAATVRVAWKFVRGDWPGPRTRQAAEAADILFALGSAQPGRYDPVKESKPWGNERTNTWRPHFEAAALPNAAFERHDEMFAAELEFIRGWHQGDPSARTFPTMLAVNPPSGEPI
jgi:hypothetical protein